MTPLWYGTIPDADVRVTTRAIYLNCPCFQTIAKPFAWQDKMASFATLLVILSVSCAAEIKGISKRADTKNNVCSEHSKGLSFLQTEGLLNLHQKS